ncbi:MAG: AmmeMemoRadiSam system protein A [Spongiibacteraceae bacterium]
MTQKICWARRMFTEAQGQQLLAIARAAIAETFDIHCAADRSAAWLQEPAACFVTLTQHDELRGCIGSLEPRRTLLEDIESNARAAAFSDPRFERLTREELDRTDIEVSILSPSQPIIFRDENDALKQLRPGIDGVVFEYGHLRSTFLPQVWEQLPTPQEFMAHLKVKAGLPINFWGDAIKLSRYTVTKFCEHR